MGMGMEMVMMTPGMAMVMVMATIVMGMVRSMMMEIAMVHT